MLDERFERRLMVTVACAIFCYRKLHGMVGSEHGRDVIRAQFEDHTRTHFCLGVFLMPLDTMSFVTDGFVGFVGFRFRRFEIESLVVGYHVEVRGSKQFILLNTGCLSQ